MKLYLIDGYGFVFRAFHSLPPLTRDDGTPIGAVYGFTNMLYKFLSNHEADMIAVVLDSGQKNFRHDLYPAYKAQRPEAPAELIPQFPIIREVIEAFGLTAIEKIGYEADDLIATYAHAAVKAGHEVKIVSSDKDLMQLVSDKIQMYDAMRDRLIDSEQVIKKFEVKPSQVKDLLSLIGDSSDNIPGVKGIGQKTAAELINEFGSLENIYQNIDHIKQARRKQLLLEGKENAFLSQKLISLDDHVAMDHEFEKLKIGELDKSQLADFFAKQGFKNLLAKLGRSEKAKPEARPEKILPINKVEDLVKHFPKFAKNGYLSLILSNQGISITSVDINLEFAQQQGSQASLFQGTNDLLTEEMLRALKPIFENTSIKKILIQAKGLIKTLSSLNISLHAFDDVALMAYSLDTGKHGYSLKELAQVYLGYEAESSSSLYQLFFTLEHQMLKHKVLTLYNRIERPMVERLSAMELKGVKIDQDYLLHLSQEFHGKLRQLETKIWQLAGKEFNIGSPKQLGTVLFEDMNIKGLKKSKTGTFSTSAEVLESLADQGFEIADLILQWRQFSKLTNTYTEALPKSINHRTGRIHTTFAMTVTSTGRLSSLEPNLQNIPIRTEEGNKIRKAFIADKDNVLISADYSQIELRLLAHLADIATLKDAFLHQQDIHAITASQMFGVPLEKVDSDLRRKAKTINFGIIYGISAYGLARRLDIPRESAHNYIESYFKQYPGIKEYMSTTIDFARKHGFVYTIFGRRCYINGINDKNFNIRSFAERAAINAPLQGTAADLIKSAMVNLPDEIAKYMILQVHDELVFEMPADMADKAIQIIKNTMEKVVALSVPITVEVRKGSNWLTAH
jgi:DNA polymerase-1